MRDSKQYVSAQLLNLLIPNESGKPNALRALLRQTGLNPDAAADPHARINVDDVSAAVSALWDQLGAQGGLQLAQQLNVYRSNHLLMSIMSHCGTLEKAIEKLVQYHDVASNAVKLLFVRDEGGATLIWQADLPLEPKVEQVLVEAAVAACVLMFRDVTAGQAEPQSVRFAYPAPGDTQPYRLFFHCPVSFHQTETGITLQAQTLRLPIVMSDPQLLAVLEEYAGNLLAEIGSGTSGQVLRFVKEAILRGQGIKIQSAAKQFSLSVRTLQIRLQAEGASYRGILETAKKEIAIQSLSKGRLPLTDIAFLLGFSEQSAFNHAFRRWTGQSPRQFAK